jgi:S-adenosylmethionine decarboxylase
MKELVTFTGFEGPEKRLEIDFKFNSNRSNVLRQGLRAISKDQWQEMLNFSSCTIISEKKNEFFDSYVLSESSLFVFPLKIMIKTCGTTTLLKIIPKLLEYASQCSLEVEYVTYSRKNFLFPEKQVFPHNDWNVELNYLGKYFEGQSYVLGPITKDHWYLYVADYSEPSNACSNEVTLEIMMHNLDSCRAIQFYRKEEGGERDKFPGVAKLINGQETDEFNFTPCGYSMNGLKNRVYSTIHVTPEPHCSYASFETNLPLLSYKKLILEVFSLFKPATVTLTIFRENMNSQNDLDFPGYNLEYKTVSHLGGNRNVVMCNFELKEISSNKDDLLIDN